VFRSEIKRSYENVISQIGFYRTNIFIDLVDGILSDIVQSRLHERSNIAVFQIFLLLLSFSRYLPERLPETSILASSSLKDDAFLLMTEKKWILHRVPREISNLIEPIRFNHRAAIRYNAYMYKTFLYIKAMAFSRFIECTLTFLVFCYE